MRFEVYEMENLLMRVSWLEPGITKDMALVENVYGSKHICCMPISLNEGEYEVPFTDVLKFLESRCVPRTRVDIEWLLKNKYNLKEYNPLAMCMQTHGVSMSDYVWLRFGDESITFDSVRVRR